jgi:hypothetical protein
MTSRVVKKHEIKRMLDEAAARGTPIICIDLLPGGVHRFHLTAPNAANDDREDEETKAWDAALE